jgi:hypothetical protein
MIDIQNRGKSLTFIKLCEEWGFSWKYEYNEKMFNRNLIITYNKNPELTCVVNESNIQGDKWGTLIDTLVDFKYSNLEYFK